jgi:beta-galactosidase
MKGILLIFSLLISVGMYAQKNSLAAKARTISFDDNWLFKKDSTINASTANYNDANWRKLDLPHDWSIEDLPDQKGMEGFWLVVLHGTANILL